MQKKNNVKINYYLINYDLQKSWNLSNEEEEINKIFKL